PSRALGRKQRERPSKAGRRQGRGKSSAFSNGTRKQWAAKSVAAAQGRRFWRSREGIAGLLRVWIRGFDAAVASQKPSASAILWRRESPVDLEYRLWDIALA